MKWQGSLLLITLLACPAPAQQPPTPVPTPPGAAPAPVESSIYPEPAPSNPVGTTSPSIHMPGSVDTREDRLSGNHNFANFINWMSNPLSNIDPRAVTAVYPIFGSTWVSNAPPIPNADVQLYGPAVTVALSDRFAMGLNQGGYAAMHPSRNPVHRQRLLALDPLGQFRDVETSGERKGWVNLGGFFQYTLVQDVESQFLLTAGLRWIVPAGSREIFQGHGPLELAPYVTVGKELGKFHVLATTGYQFPAGPGNDNVQAFYVNVHVDRQCFGWLYPLVEFNTNYLTKGASLDLRTRRGFIDFGNFESTGNIVSLAAGANAVLIRERVELGAVYTTVVASQRDFSANGLLVKMTLRY